MPDEPAAGPALDAEICRVVFGLLAFKLKEPRFGSEFMIDRGDGYGAIYSVPAYSTEIAAAWQVVERMRSKGFTTEIDICAHDCNGKEFTCVFSDENSAADERPEWHASAETMPRAICLAALRALSREVGDAR